MMTHDLAGDKENHHGENSHRQVQLARVEHESIILTTVGKSTSDWELIPHFGLCVLGRLLRNLHGAWAASTYFRRT
jgi:hypothetical protein